MPNATCSACGKTAYPLESVTAGDKVYHKLCFKCTTCQMTLNLKNFKVFDSKVYCNTHTPKVKNTAIGTDTVLMKSAISAPKKSGGALGVHKADPKVAPKASGDFTVNQSGDQSTENNPENSSITYEQHSGDQSTENAPESSTVTYEQHSADQSTENAPDDSQVSYEEHPADQSTGGEEYQQEEQYQ